MLHRISSYKTKLFLLFLTFILAISLCSCSAPSSVQGTWRLESGSFAYGFSSYDRCAIEFTDYGEYIIYTDTNYESDTYHGSYSFNGKQLSFLDDVLSGPINCTLDGNQMVLVTSDGAATFSKVNMQASVKGFDENTIFDEYKDTGYTIDNFSLAESSNTSRIYDIHISQNYPYMDEVLHKQVCYNYSAIGQYWYRSHTKTVDSYEVWHVNGLWTLNEKYGSNHTLYIYSVSSDEAVIDYCNDYGYKADTFSGSYRAETTYNMWIDSSRKLKEIHLKDEDGLNYGSIYIDPIEGVRDPFPMDYAPYTYQGE